MAVLYSELRQNIKTGDLVAWKTTSIGSFFDLVLFLYQKIFKANYTHVGVIVRLGDRLLVVEATPPCVRLVPLTMLGDFYYLPTKVNASPETQVKFLFRKLGIKYSILDLIRSTFSLSRNKDDYYCSILVGDFYNDLGYLFDRKVGRTPDTIVQTICDKYGTEPVFVLLDKANLHDV